MIEDPQPIRLQVSVFYLAREQTRSMLLSCKAVLKMDDLCSFCATRLFSVLWVTLGNFLLSVAMTNNSQVSDFAIYIEIYIINLHYFLLFFRIMFQFLTVNAFGHLGSIIFALYLQLATCIGYWVSLKRMHVCHITCRSLCPVQFLSRLRSRSETYVLLFRRCRCLPQRQRRKLFCV